jgi:ABC-type multidrug transport system fused ATPase/permease subunit
LALDRSAVEVSSVGGPATTNATHGSERIDDKKRTIGLIVFGVLIVLIVSIFAVVAALQWWVATISALAVPVIIAVGMVAAIVGYQNFNTQIRDLRTQLRLAHEEIGKLEETIRRLQAPSRKTRPTHRGGGRATRKIESTYSTQTNGRHLPE